MGGIARATLAADRACAASMCVIQSLAAASCFACGGECTRRRERMVALPAEMKRESHLEHKCS